MSMFFVFLCSLLATVYGGGGDDAVNVPVWTDTRRSSNYDSSYNLNGNYDNSYGNNNGGNMDRSVAVPVTSQQSYSTPIPVQVYRDSYSPPPRAPAVQVPVFREQGGNNPRQPYTIPVPIYRDPQPQQAYSTPLRPTPQAYSVPVVVPMRDPTPRPLAPTPNTIFVPIWKDPVTPTPRAPLPPIIVPIWKDPVDAPTQPFWPPTQPNPVIVPVPIWKDPVNSPTQRTPVAPSPTQSTIIIPIWKDPINSPTQPTPLWRDPIPPTQSNPIIIPVPIWTDPPNSPTQPTMPRGNVPTPAFFPDPPAWAPSTPTRRPRPPRTPSVAAPTNPAILTPTEPPSSLNAVPTRRRPRTRAPTIGTAPFAQVYSVSPAGVCASVRRNLRINGTGFLNPPANYSCVVTPSCEDNYEWVDRFGFGCEDYQGLQCDPDAAANCRKSCGGSCPTVACQDRDEFLGQCASYRNQGKCETDPNFMMLQCPVTCSYCGMFPAFVLSDSLLACQAPALGGQGSVFLEVRRDQAIWIGEFQLQSYDCQNNETSDPPAINAKDLAAIVARPVSGSFGPGDTSMNMQFFIENIGLLDLAGPVLLHVESVPNVGRRLLEDTMWCSPTLPMGMIVSCSVTRAITNEEQAAKALITSVWAEATFQGSVVTSTVYTFKTSVTTPPPSSATTPFINQQIARGTTVDACSWRTSASCWPWWAWLILALLILSCLLCCIAAICCYRRRDRETSRKEVTSYVYRKPRPQASPPVAQSPSPHISEKEPIDPHNDVEEPAVRLLFNTSSGPFEVRGPESEAPSHFVFEKRGSANSLSHSPTAGRRSVSFSNQRRETRDHVVFNEAT